MHGALQKGGERCARDRYRTFAVSYFEGLRYPKLERVARTPARLDAILAPRP